MPGRGVLGERSHEGHDLAVRLEGVVQIEMPNLEPDGSLEAGCPRKGTHRKPPEDLVRLLDELLGPPDDRIDDGDCLAPTGEGSCLSHEGTSPQAARDCPRDGPP